LSELIHIKWLLKFVSRAGYSTEINLCGTENGVAVEPGIGNSAEFYSLRGRYTADLGEITHPKNGS
jgi:hypothetical protein